MKLTNDELCKIAEETVGDFPRPNEGASAGVATDLRTGIKFGFDSTQDRWHNIWAIDEDGTRIFFKADKRPTMTWREAYEELKLKREKRFNDG